MSTNIQNSSELQAEILRLRNLRFELEHELLIETNKVTSKLRLPLKLFSKLNTWFAAFNHDDTKNSTDNVSRDWVTNVFQIGLPVMLDKFIFPRSGFILKYVVEFLSQNTAKSINKTVVSDWIEKLFDWVKSTKRNNKQEPRMLNNKIPPHSQNF